MAEIARLEPVDLRDVWFNEERDFTPWLAENLDRLGDVLDMDLELIKIEAPVGSFSLDILPKDINDDRMVVIENQLEGTNHDHLGKALTYAAGFDADVMVWIVKEFRDEHRQALDWLNQRTSEKTEFYGVVIRTVRIRNSPHATIFEVVARPNTFRKSRIGSGENPQSSKTQQRYLAFWPKILDSLRDHNLTKKSSSTTKSWLAFASGIPGVQRNLKFTMNAAGVELYLDSGDKDRNKQLYDSLQNQRARLEKAFGEVFTWERLNDGSASRIALYRPNASVNDPEETWNGTADWMVANYVKLVETVIPIVKEVVQGIDDEDSEPANEEDRDQR